MNDMHISTFQKLNSTILVKMEITTKCGENFQQKKKKRKQYRISTTMILLLYY